VNAFVAAHSSLAATAEFMGPRPATVAVVLVLGSLSVQSETSFTVFELDDNNDLEFCVRGNTILLPRLRVGSNSSLLIDVVDGHVLMKNPGVEFLYRPGKVTVNYAQLREQIPDWALSIIQNDAGLNLEEQPLLDLEAFLPGVLRVKGVWVRRDYVVIINDNQLSFIYPGLIRPVTLIGEGDGTQSTLKLSGPSILFGISDQYLKSSNMQP
jgi:hypothetical protein